MVHSEAIRISSLQYINMFTIASEEQLDTHDQGSILKWLCYAFHFVSHRNALLVYASTLLKGD